MEYFDFKELYENVDFIQDNMQIYSFNDFFENCLIIKHLYCELPRQGKKLYQWYLFASSLTNNQKRIVWNYINGWFTYQELLQQISIDKHIKYNIHYLEQRNNYE